MRHYAGYSLPGLLLAAVLILTACGGQQGGAGSSGDMQGMGHGEKTETTGGMSGGAHGDPRHGDAAQALMEDGEYSDKRFIDMMIPHHLGAVHMARIALGEAEHEEIKRLSRDIVSTQRREIEELRDIRQRVFGTRDISRDMSSGDIEMMGMTDPQELKGQRPFDRAFIDAMIPHHRSAIHMAEVALQKSENPRIRDLAQNIVEAQQREIEHMRQWRQKWYPES